ncbi:MAG: hypothetical protein HYX48_00780 [Chlamydiales bacterium]|nr:hypothetical protein [Chlamydiales bacterium]
MNLILCGFKKSGKSYYGKLLAERLQLPFIDTDRLIEKRMDGISCARIVEIYGEEKFRSIESEVIASLSNVRSSVIALGGGSLLSSRNAEIVSRFGKIIYLSLGRERLAKRFQNAPLPTFLDPEDFEASFQRAHEKRRGEYERIAHVTISLDDLSDEEILKQLEERWEATLLV